MVNILKEFLSTYPEEPQEFKKKLVNIDGYTYATDGKVICRVKGEYGEVVESYPDINLMHFEKLKTAEFFEINKQEIDIVRATYPCEHCKPNCGIKPEECEECKGDGDVYFENKYHEYFCDCQSCNGKGFHPRTVDSKYCEECDGTGISEYEHRTIRLLQCNVNIKYLQKTFKIPNVEFCYISGFFDGGEPIVLGFKSPKAEGFIMPMKD